MASKSVPTLCAKAHLLLPHADTACSIENLAPGVAKAAVMAGLPASSVKQFVTALLGSVGEITAVPGVDPKILGAAATAIADISAKSFEYVWIANMVIGLVSTGCKSLCPQLSLPGDPSSTYSIGSRD